MSGAVARVRHTRDMVKEWLVALGANQARRDALVAALWLALGLVLLQFGAYPLWGDVALWQTSGGAFVFTLVAMVLVATVRSRHPFVALGLGVPIIAVDLGYGGSLGVVIVGTDLVYAAMKYGSDRAVRRALMGAGALAVACAVWLIVVPFGDGAIPVIVVQAWLILLISGAWGWNVRSERKRTEARLADLHEHEHRDLQRRVAHDLHDLVANQIAVAGLHIEAAKLIASAQEPVDARIVTSLDHAKHGADQAHQRLRELIAVLSEVDGAGQGSTLDIDREIEQLRHLLPGGRQLAWQPGAREALMRACESLPEAGAMVLLRVMRELVANAAKHGRGDVLVCAGDAGTLNLRVVNEVSGDTVSAPGNGLGLAGARLLLANIGGELVADERPAEPERHNGLDGPVWCAELLIAEAG